MTSRPIVGVVPGFGSGRWSYQPLVSELEENDHDVIFFPSIRRRGIRRNKGVYPQALVRQAQVIVQLLEARGIKNVTLVGHSLGGATATVAAALAPHLISRVILVCSACVHKDSLISMGKRFFGKAQGDARYAKAANNEARAMLRLIRKEALCYFFANPWLTLREVWTLARFSALKVIAEHRLDVRFVYGERDTMFTCEPIEAALQAGKHPTDHWLRLDISHDPQNKPHEARLLVASLVQRQFLPTP